MADGLEFGDVYGGAGGRKTQGNNPEVDQSRGTGTVRG